MFLDPIGERTARDQLLYLGIIPSVLVIMLVFVAVVMMVALMLIVLVIVAMGMCVCVRVRMRMDQISMAMFVLVLMRMFVLVAMLMIVVCDVVMMLAFDMHIEFCPGDRAFLIAPHMQVIALEAELAQFALELLRVDAEVNQRTDEHVAAEAAEDIEVKCFHVDIDSAASELIWLAA